MIIVISCSASENPNFVYEQSDLNLIGWKNKGGFETDFPEADFSRWGYIKGREVAIILYATPELANNFGQIVGQEQTEIIEQSKTNSDSGDSGSFYGPKVEFVLRDAIGKEQDAEVFQELPFLGANVLEESLCIQSFK